MVLVKNRNESQCQGEGATARLAMGGNKGGKKEERRKKGEKSRSAKREYVSGWLPSSWRSR